MTPEADGDVGITELFGPPRPHFRPPPVAEEVFPAAMFVPAPTRFDVMSDAMAGLPPGHPSGPMPIVPMDPAAVTGPLLPPPPPPPPPEPPRRRRRTALLVGVVAVALVGAGGAAAYSAAHKTVTLDVDGELTTVETFEGDVGDLLAAEGVQFGGRDAVRPGVDGALRDGGTVVVRYGHRVTLRADGERQAAWVTALDADEALATLSEQGDDVVLLPARAGGTATLPMRLDTDASVNLVVTGKERQVVDGDARLDALLAEHRIRVDGDDRITVERALPADPGTPTVSVVVRKVKASIVETVSEEPFETVTATDPNHYVDQPPYVATEGAVGKRVTSWDVTRVDGKVVEKEKLNSWISEPPVDRVIMYGGKARPAPEPKSKPKGDSEDGTKPGSKSGATSDPKSDPKSDPRSGSEPKTRSEPTSGPESKPGPTTRGEVSGKDPDKEPKA